MKDRKVVALYGREGGDKLEVEWGETIIMMYYVKRNYFQQKEK